MNRWKTKLFAIALLSAGMLVLASCTPEKKEEPATKEAVGAASSSGYASSVSVKPGEAGGVEEDTFTVSVTVSAIDASTRQVTLTGDSGDKATFIAGPEVKNFDQIRVGDKVTATITERLNVFVRSDGASPSVTHAAALATAPKGARPGAMVGQAYEIVASVKSIDSDTRTATIQFADGQTRTVQARPDVDLSRYKVGDSVVIQVSEALSLMVEKP